MPSNVGTDLPVDRQRETPSVRTNGPVGDDALQRVLEAGRRTKAICLTTCSLTNRTDIHVVHGVHCIFIPKWR